MSKTGKRLIAAAEEALAIAKGLKEPARIHGPAIWTYDNDSHGGAWYVRIEPRTKPPYRRQIHVEAIIDVAEDGTMAGIEIIDHRAPRPMQLGAAPTPSTLPELDAEMGGEG